MEHIYQHSIHSVPQAGQGFWHRQFGDVPTRAQLRFDAAFGLVVPVLCFVFDPVVFQGGVVGGDGIYRSARLFAYAASAVCIATLACWLFVVRRFPEWSKMAGGVMAAGALFAFALGLMILPLSLIGLLFAGVGALGFTPFVACVVYARNARRALRLNRVRAPVRGGALAAFAFGAAVVFGLPAAAQHSATRAMSGASEEILSGGELSPSRLRLVRALTRVSGERFVEMRKQHSREADGARRERLAGVYFELTGDDINRRRPSLLD